MAVLFVDDESTILTLFKEVCRVQKIPHFLASSASEAMAVCSREEIRLVVTDYSMPEMNGDDLAKRIKQEYPDMPVFCFSGSNPRDMARALGNPFDKVFEKPTSFSRLLAEVVQALTMEEKPSPKRPG